MTQNASGTSRTGTRYFPSYHNEPPQTAKNICGQAAVAAMLDFHGIHQLGVEKINHVRVDGASHWPNAQAINAISRLHPPDCLFGLLGTSAQQLVAALRYWGLWARASRPSSWAEIENWVRNGLPVITIVNRSSLGERFRSGSLIDKLRNQLPVAHWAIIYGIEDPYVYVANTENAERARKDHYYRAMSEWWMAPLGFRNCAVFVAPKQHPKVS